MRRDEALRPVVVDSLSEAKKADRDKPTARELQARLISYADSYLAKLAEVTVEFEKDVKSPEARDFALSTFVFPGLTVVGIASGDDPPSDLLDMVVFASLQRQAMEGGWAAEVLGEHAKPLIEVQRQEEAAIWHIAEEVLTRTQQSELRALIEDWRRRNPNQRYVSNVRFDDVAVIRGKDVSRKAVGHSEGLLAPVDEAAHEIDEVRMLAERMIYLMQRMPPLVLAQARHVVHESLSPEDVDALVADFDRISKSVEQAEKTFAAIPQHLASERQAFFGAIDKRQDKLSGLLGSTESVFAAGKDAAVELRQTLKVLEDIVKTYETGGPALNETIRNYRGLLEYMDAQPPSDMTQFLHSVEGMTQLGRQINQFTGQVGQLPATQGAELLVVGAERLLNAVLVRLLVLIVVTFALTLLYRYLARRYLGHRHAG